MGSSQCCTPSARIGGYPYQVRIMTNIFLSELWLISPLEGSIWSLFAARSSVLVLQCCAATLLSQLDLAPVQVSKWIDSRRQTMIACRLQQVHLVTDSAVAITGPRTTHHFAKSSTPFTSDMTCWGDDSQFYWYAWLMTRFLFELSSFIWFDAQKMFPLTCQSLACHLSVGFQRERSLCPVFKTLSYDFCIGHYFSLWMIDFLINQHISEDT